MELRFHLERPNPNYKDRERVEQIIEGANASVADLVLRASDDDAQGLDLDDEIIQQGIDHATRKYGTFKAVGERPGEPEVAWKSDKEQTLQPARHLMVVFATSWRTTRPQIKRMRSRTRMQHELSDDDHPSGPIPSGMAGGARSRRSFGTRCDGRICCRRRRRSGGRILEVHR